MSEPAPAASGPGTKPLESSITLEKSYRVDGRKVTFSVTVPASLAREIGMDAMLACAQRLVLKVESKQAKVEALRLGEN